MELSKNFNIFFKANQLRQSSEFIQLEGVQYERMYLEYYENLIKEFKKENMLKMTKSGQIRESSWEPLFRAGHHGAFLSFKDFQPHLTSKKDFDKFLELLSILSLHGFGNFSAESSEDGEIEIIVIHCFEDKTFADTAPLNPYTAGMILGCYNLAYSSMHFLEMDQVYAEKIYAGSPEIEHSQFGLLHEGKNIFKILYLQL
ncbi:MAG: hypothetical protein OEV66_06895 [Spirochaetia bacterium]|nr:hypothetical protein [Spirochaetia bacterium]